MRSTRAVIAAWLIGGGVWSIPGGPASAEAVFDLMGRVPSVGELVSALTPVKPVKTRGIRPADAPGAGARPRPAVDLEVRFEFDSYRLTPMARAVLDNLATALTTDLAPYQFILEGHTDAVGSEGYNLELSQRRAQAVQDYLRELYQIAPARLSAIGKGESELLLPEQPRAAPNRRVRVINRG
jgi:outer membrane protein OmpA-like peptidoglycan-associated protein